MYPYRHHSIEVNSMHKNEANNHDRTEKKNNSNNINKQIRER